MTVAMRVFGIPVVIAIAMVGTIMAQEECFSNSDCMDHQYCYEASKICVNYTDCGRYNRRPNSKPSKTAAQCGACIPGYSAEPNLDGNVYAEICQKNDAQTEQRDSWKIVLSSIIVAIILALLFTLVIYYFCNLRAQRNKSKWSNADLKVVLPMLRGSTDASAPPLPSPTMMSRNNNKYDDALEDIPLSSIAKDCRADTVIDIIRPVKAQAFRSPDWVNSDSSYNPVDNVTTVATFVTPPETDEDTIPSPWTPGEENVESVSSRPFAAISTEQQDNTANSALARVVCPSPSTSQERRESRQSNGSSASADFGSGDTRGNRRGNSGTPIFSNHIQFNFVNQSGCGKGH